MKKYNRQNEKYKNLKRKVQKKYFSFFSLPQPPLCYTNVLRI